MMDRWELLQLFFTSRASVPAFEVCRSLLDGEARIVDCFDHGERRFVVVEPGVHTVPLTPKERSVVLSLAHELSNKVVALDLAISQATASTLLGAALRKLGVDRWTLLRALAVLPTAPSPDPPPVFAQSA